MGKRCVGRGNRNLRCGGSDGRLVGGRGSGLGGKRRCVAGICRYRGRGVGGWVGWTC